jgi:hypothetical protein
MKNLVTKLSLAALAIVSLSLCANAQTALTQTTLSTSIASTSTRTIQVASATGIAAPALPAYPGGAAVSTQLYIDDEVLDVTAVNGTVITVRRGANGSKARTHASGTNVYAAPVSLGAFIDYSLAGSCPSGSYPATPMVDYADSETFQCVNGMWAVQTVGGQQHFPNILLQATAYTNATTTFSSVSSLSFPVSANHTYTGTCTVVYQGTATTAGPKWQLTGPASPTTVLLAVDGGTGAAAYADVAATAFSSAITAFGTLGATSTNYVGHVAFSIVNGVNAGTVTLQAAANGSGTLTIAAGSYCIQQ